MRFARTAVVALAASSSFIAAAPTGPAAAVTAELFISEYVEGSSNNKAIEIYNGTGSSVDLAGYSLQMFFNGNPSVGLTIALTGSVADGDVHVVAHSSAAAAILAEADQTSGAGFFNGDDAVVLTKDGAPVDSLGEVGFDPGSQWGADLTSTADNTLRRKSSICAGDPVVDDAFDPAIEWDGFAQDTFDGIGAHVADCGDGEATPVINEFSASTTGTDVEYVEVKAAAGADLSTYVVLEIEGDSGGTGTVDEVIALGVADASGYFLADLAANTLENGTITLLLVEGFSGVKGDDLDTDDDGLLDATPWTSVVDDVAVSDGGASDRTYAATVLGPNFDGLSTFAPGGASRIPDGADSGAIADWARNDFDLYGIPGFAGSPAVGEAVNTPGSVNELITVLPPRPLKIHEIQGDGDVSPELGNGAIIEGVVTNAPDTDPDGVAETFGGFYVQEEDADVDGDPLTSEGIFVFSSGNVPVSIGDVVRVTGFVDEFGGLTEITDVESIEVIGTAPLPTAVEITFPLAPGADLEPYESMLVTMPQTLVVSEYFNYDRFGEIVVALPADGHERPMNPTAVYDEDSPEAAELEDLNERSRITIDDGSTQQNVSEPVHPINRELFSLTNAFRGGDTVSGLTGTLHYAFGSFRLMPLPNEQGYETFERTVAPVAPDAVGGDLRVATLNALNYFLTLDDGSNTGCGPDLSMGCRGADENQADEFARQRVKLINALVGLDADVIGLNEVENTAGVEALADIVAGLNDRLGAGAYDYIPAGTDGVVGTDAIKVGLIYRTSAVAPLGDAAVLDTPEFLDPLDSGTSKNRAAVAQTFVEVDSGEVFSVVVNHLKSKGSECPGDFHPLAGNCNLTRTLAAQELADWIATDPTGTADQDWLIIGDLNSYDKEDPIDALRDAGYTDLILQEQGELAYSFVFDGEFGYLDYLMSSPSMTAQVTGATEWHINADEPDIFDYDTSFKSDYQDSLFDPTTPFRSSDHDAALVGLSLDAGFDSSVAADPSMIWPPNHTLRPIELVPATDGAEIDVLSASSSEADSGLGDDDVPNDIVIDGDDVQVRAERYSLDGRTYTIEVAVTYDGQVVLTDATVIVEHDQRDRRSQLRRSAR